MTEAPQKRVRGDRSAEKAGEPSYKRGRAGPPQAPAEGARAPTCAGVHRLPALGGHELGEHSADAQ